MLYPPSASEDLKFAIRRFESGLFEQAGAQLLAILQKNPKDQDALYFLRLVQRRLAGNSLQLAPGALPPAALIWQLDPAGAWERDWLHEVLAGCFTTEAVDKTWSKMAPVMIVVDNRIVPEKAFYYREAFEAGYRIILVHLLPNCLPPLLVVAMVQIAAAISLEATLSFLGLGLPITEPSLGLLIANGFSYLLSGKYWISLFPGLALLLLIVSLNLVGDRLRDLLDPRLQ